MSWSGYLDNLGKGLIQGYVIGRDGSLWAEPTTNTTLLVQKASAEELKTISEHMSNNDKEFFQANGIHLGGTKFFCLSLDENILKGKKGADSFVACITKTCLIIAHCGADMQIGELNNQVVKNGQHLLESGF